MSPRRTSGSRLLTSGSRLRERLGRLAYWHDQFFVARWRSALRREARAQEDLFAGLLLLRAYGIDDPAGLHTMELTPHLLESFHRWHRSQGMERFPEVCC